MSAAPEVLEPEKSKKEYKNPWGLVEKPVEVQNLTEVMSEQLAKDLVEKEERKLDDFPVEESLFQASNDACADDLLIAQMLQMQFDKEYDQALAKEEQHHNGSSKVTVSYSKYKVIPDNPIWDDEDDSEDDAYFVMDDRKRPLDCYEVAEKETGALPKCGYKKVGDKIVTKHDRDLSHRSNGKRMMNFQGIETGDGGGMDVMISNPVFNKIRNFNLKENKRKSRVRDKTDKSTVSQAVDDKTRLILFKMVNNGVLESVGGVISIGKEAVIMEAEGGDLDDGLKLPANCAVKVFKTSLNEFKTRDKYIKDDKRFKDRFGKQNPRKIVHIWAEKELHNLLKMERFGVRVPKPVLLKKHVLVMELIGDDEGRPAPKIKDAVLSRSDLESAHWQTVSMMHTLYSQCKLVHADLSEYNILWVEASKQVFFIDVSQSVEPNHPHGLEFLLRDCTNVVNFFSRMGLDSVGSPMQLFTSVTGLPLDKDQTEAEVINQVRSYQKNDQILRDLPQDSSLLVDSDYVDAVTDSNFDHCWRQSQNNSSPVPIPGTTGSNFRMKMSAKSPSSGAKSPGSSAKSPRTNSLAGLSDQELKNLKEEVLAETVEPHEASVVTFEAS